MDAITKVEGTLSGLSVHLGTGLKAVGWAQQKFEQLQREFVGLKAELKKARGDLERSEAWNERLREQLQAEGIEIMDTGEIDYGLVVRSSLSPP